MPKFPFGDIGPCEVVWNYPGPAGAVKLSPFKGTVSFKHEDSVAKVEEESFGDTPVDGVFSGGPVEMNVPMTRSTLAKLEAVLPGADLAGSVLTISNKCGSDMYADAKAVCIKPVKDGVVSLTPSEWTLFFKCHPYKAYEIGYDRSGQRVFQVKFMVFPDQTSGLGGRLYQIGVL